MAHPIVWLTILGPLALAATGSGLAAPRTLAAARLASLLALAMAVLAAVATAVAGPQRIMLPGFGIVLDALSATMFLLVAFVGAIVIGFTRHYLDGDPGQDRFVRLLCLTLASVLTLIVSAHFVQFAFAWIATSAGLQRLLLFYPERPAARLAARKKFLVSRLGDACLIAAFVLLYRASGSAAIPAANGLASFAPALLLVCAGMLKSAQFPMHGWLIEVMETPTPVSALLHAGLINAGGFLVLRFADVIAPQSTALDLLVVIGGISAMFGSLVMLTQTSVKVALAYSTIAQMGFMMFECGLGAYSAALLHIVAHSLYKAHAFLSSGSVIDIARGSWQVEKTGASRPGPVALVAGAVAAVCLWFGQPLVCVMLLGLVHLVANGIDRRPNSDVIARVVLAATLVAVLSVALQFGAWRFLAGALPPHPGPMGGVGEVAAWIMVLGFAALTVFQSALPRHATEPRWQALYALVANGFYVNTLANRFVLRLWPGGRRRVS